MKLLCIILFIFTYTFLHSIKKVTLLCDKNYFPYAFQKNGKARGVHPNIMQKINKQMPDYEINIKPVPWNRALMLLKNGKYLGAIGTYYRPVQRDYINSYSFYLYQEEIILIALKNHKFTNKTKWPDDFANSKIGVNFGYAIGERDFFTKLSKFGIKKIEMATINQSLQMLLRKRLDLYANSKLAIILGIKQADLNKNDFKTITTIIKEKSYVGFSKNFKATWKYDFINKLNAVLKQMHKTNEIERIVDFYINNNKKISN